MKSSWPATLALCVAAVSTPAGATTLIVDTVADFGRGNATPGTMDLCGTIITDFADCFGNCTVREAIGAFLGDDDAENVTADCMSTSTGSGPIDTILVPDWDQFFLFFGGIDIDETSPMWNCTGGCTRSGNTLTIAPNPAASMFFTGPVDLLGDAAQTGCANSPLGRSMGGSCFYVNSPGLTVTFDNWWIQNAEGGAIVNDGSTVIILDSTFTNNGQFGVFGGAYWNRTGIGTVDNSRFWSNAATWGGAIDNDDELTITMSYIDGNEAENEGGGIYHEGIRLDISHTMIMANMAPRGAGMALRGGRTMPGGAPCIITGRTDTTLEHSVVALNQTSTNISNPADVGGGIYYFPSFDCVGDGNDPVDETDGSLTITNSTISDNTADNSGGGLIMEDGPPAGNRELYLNNATVALNTTNNGDGGGLAISRTLANDTVEVRNTLVGDNIDGTMPLAHTCAGVLDSHGYNLLEDVNAGACTVNEVANPGTDIHGMDPGLAQILSPMRPFQEQPTLPTSTHALRLGSPAIDSANPGGCEDNNMAALTSDQRDATRPVNGVCDIGAYEHATGGAGGGGNCGDTFVQPPLEDCDDGNTTDDGNGCSATCTRIGTCSDGMIQSYFEECDDGMMNSDSAVDTCRTDCTNARCGDGVQDTAEACDDGNITDDGNGCSTTCQRAGSCGDGTEQSLFEECDQGGANSDTEPNACRTTCVDPTCGDNVQDAGEACDDGNTTDDGNGCSATCQRAGSCGDGTVQALFEECDDMNTNSFDGCDSACMTEMSGDSNGGGPGPGPGGGGDTDAFGDPTGGCDCGATDQAMPASALMLLGLLLRRRRRR